MPTAELYIVRARTSSVVAEASVLMLRVLSPSQVRQLEMERFSMSKALDGGDKAAAGRIKALDKQLNELKKEQGVRTIEATFLPTAV